MTIRVAFDIGGTFTDLVLHDSDRSSLVVRKVPTTPTDLTRAVLDGLASLLGAAARQPEEVEIVLHATTVATNAVLARQGARTALITTRGFRDVLLIGRQKRYNTYDLYLDKPAPLIRRRAIHEVDERIGFDGETIVPLDAGSVDRAIDALLADDVESVAVALLHAYANPAHERSIGRCLEARCPGLSVTLSSDVSPKYREYERISTTVANAYVRPIMDRYIASLQQALVARGFPPGLAIMQSNGGLVSPGLVRKYPVRVIESGPAAGVLMCAAIGRDEGIASILTFDMGGTTAKLGAVDDGVPVITATFEVDNRHFRKHSGLPLNVAAVELVEIGNGGGSIATTDMGVIRVGPASAGARPGPICYGAGGSAPTVTDANLVLGYLDPGYFNGGTMRLDPDAAAAGIAQHLARPLGIDVATAAWGIHAVANSNMEAAMRVISIERGRDPRRYALVAFGGAGPIHAARLARALGIPQVIVPRGAGVGSAIGLLEAGARIDVSLTRIMALADGAGPAIAAVYAELEARAGAELAELAATAAPQWSRHAYMRHAGQGFEIRVDLPGGAIDGDGYVARCRAAFLDAYERQYGYRDRDAAIEAVDWQLVAATPGRDGAAATTAAIAAQTRGGTAAGRRDAYFPEAGGTVSCRVVDRYAMAPSEAVAGPAVIEEREATTLVLPGDTARLSARGNLVITIAAGAARDGLA